MQTQMMVVTEANSRIMSLVLLSNNVQVENEVVDCPNELNRQNC